MFRVPSEACGSGRPRDSQTGGITPIPLPSTHQRVPLHVLAPRELLPADLAGVGPLAGVGAHVSLEDALVHGGEAAVGALELLPDDRELVDWKTAHRGHQQPSGPLPTLPAAPQGQGSASASQTVTQRHPHIQPTETVPRGSQRTALSPQLC